MSCDTYYYTLAEKLGIDKIAYWAHEVGLGQKTGIDLPGEVSGTMPSEEWKMKTFHEKWYAGETISVGIGQGAVAVTPDSVGAGFRRHCLRRRLQAAPCCRSRSAAGRVSPGDVSTRIRAVATVTIPIDPGNLGDHHRWHGRGYRPRAGGTAFASHLENIDFAGKTGTAQVVNHSAGMKSLGADCRAANAWFVGIAPRRNPDIAVVVLVGAWWLGSRGVGASGRAGDRGLRG